MTHPNTDAAQTLLTSSFGVAAERIYHALARSLQVTNSKHSTNPHNIPGYIVGLCGQSGRHPYFRIQVTDLQAAVVAILQAHVPQAGATTNPQQTIAKIAAACRQLRSVTIFDSNTGCVNDQLPSMVPLLPPEEIWLEDREMPLDIWRLVSLEFDLVSSAVSSQVPVDDFAFAAVTPSALAFRAMIDQLGTRRTEFDVMPKQLPLPLGALLPSARRLVTSLARVYFEAGCLLTPLAANDYTKWYSAIRYFHWIHSGTRELRVDDRFSADTVDSRYRGLFAEETGVGIMAIILTDVFGAIRINNTVEINPALAGSKLPIADFVSEAIQGIPGQRVTLISEAKGSVGKNVSKSRRDRAKEQVRKTNAFIPGSSTTLRMTFCSNIWFVADAGPTQCLVDDPPEDQGTTTIEVDPVLAWRFAYAKAFRFVGLDSAAVQVVEGEPVDLPTMRPATDLERRDDSRQAAIRRRRFDAAREELGVELLIDAGNAGIALDERVAQVVRHGITSESILKLEDTLVHRRRRDLLDQASFVTALGLGCVFYG